MATSETRRRITRWPTTWADEGATLLPLLLVLIGGFWLAGVHQTDPGDLAWATLVVLATQTLPGAVLWRSVRPVSGWLVEDLAMGTAIGAALAVPAQVLSVRYDHAGIQYGLGWLVAYVAFFLPWSRRRILRAEWYRLPLWWGWLVGLSGVGALAVSTRAFSQMLPGHNDWATQYIDVPYHVALTAELEHRFPPHTPQVASETLDYHWFSHAWLGNIAGLTDVPNDILLTRWAPIFVALFVVIGLACLGTRLGGPTTGGVLAVGAVVVRQVTVFSSWSLFALFTPISPSTGFALLIGTALVNLLVARWRGESPWWAVPLLALLCLVVGGAKGSWLPMLTVACALATVVAGLGRSRFAGRIALDTCVVGLSLVTTVAVLFRGNDGGMQFTPFDSLAATAGHAITGGSSGEGAGSASVVGVTVVLLLAAALPLLGVVGLVRKGAGRDPAGWLLLGVFLAGLGGVLVFEHPGNSQAYFYQAGVPIGLAAAAWGITMLVSDSGDGRSSRGWLVALVAAVLGWLLLATMRDLVPGSEPGVANGFITLAFLAYAFVLLGVLLRAMHRRSRLIAVAAGFAGAAAVGMLRLIGAQGFSEAVIEPFELVDRGGVVVGLRPINGAISLGEFTAMRWIAENTPVDDVVMTNRHCFNVTGNCNNRRFWLAAYGERRVLVEGWGYTRKVRAHVDEAPGRRLSRVEFWDPSLLSLNDLLFDHPSRIVADALYDRGVRWVYAERSSGVSEGLGLVAQQVYANQDAVVYRLERGNQ